MARFLAALILLFAACAHRVSVRDTPPTQVDAFSVNCASAVNCAGNVPARSFTTTAAAAGGVLVIRNGLVLYPGQPASDYTAAADAAGRVTVTFAQQPVADGDLILLRYGKVPSP